MNDKQQLGPFVLKQHYAAFVRLVLMAFCLADRQGNEAWEAPLLQVNMLQCVDARV